MGHEKNNARTIIAFSFLILTLGCTAQSKLNKQANSEKIEPEKVSLTSEYSKECLDFMSSVKSNVSIMTSPKGDEHIVTNTDMDTLLLGNRSCLEQIKQSDLMRIFFPTEYKGEKINQNIFEYRVYIDKLLDSVSKSKIHPVHGRRADGTIGLLEGKNFRRQFEKGFSYYFFYDSEKKLVFFTNDKNEAKKKRTEGVHLIDKPHNTMPVKQIQPNGDTIWVR